MNREVHVSYTSLCGCEPGAVRKNKKPPDFTPRVLGGVGGKVFLVNLVVYVKDGGIPTSSTISTLSVLLG